MLRFILTQLEFTFNEDLNDGELQKASSIIGVYFWDRFKDTKNFIGRYFMIGWCLIRITL